MNKLNTVLFAMPNSLVLGAKISKKLNIELSDYDRVEFVDGEVMISSYETVRNKDVFIVASAHSPVNNNYMELFIFIDSLKRASAKSINLVLTYYGYSRQDRKSKGRQPIGAKLIADLLTTSGISKITAIDLHNPSTQGFFDIPVDDLRAVYLFAEKLKSGENFTVVSPDHGGAVRARTLAELVSHTIDIAIIDKRRTNPNEAEVLGVLGDVKNKNVVIIDDMIDSGGTIIKAARALKKQGANNIRVAASHGLFSKGFEMFENCEDISEVIVTDSIGKVYEIKSKKLHVLSLDTLLSSVITATISSTSISKHYDKIKEKIESL